MTYTFTGPELIGLILAVSILTIMTAAIFISICYLVSENVRNPFKKDDTLYYESDKR